MKDKSNQKKYNTSETRNSLSELFDNKIWMTVYDAAKYLSITPNALRIAVHRKEIIARKFRRKLYFKKIELDQQIESSY